MRCSRAVFLVVFLEVAASLPGPEGEAERAVALAADDECSAEDGAGCALSALQLRAQAAAVAALDSVDEKPKKVQKLKTDEDEDEDSEPVTPAPDPVWYQCHPPENATCPGDMTCVQSEDKKWAQCIDCKNKKLFKRDCVKWDDHLRLAGIKECGLVCPDSRCYSQEWCPGKDMHCALQDDDGWGQCFPCTKAYYKDHCAGWPSKLWKAAQKVCKLDCPARKEAEKWAMKQKRQEEKLKKKSQHKKHSSSRSSSTSDKGGSTRGDASEEEQQEEEA